jgi:hypothetical protein
MDIWVSWVIPVVWIEYSHDFVWVRSVVMLSLGLLVKGLYLLLFDMYFRDGVCYYCF